MPPKHIIHTLKQYARWTTLVCTIVPQNFQESWQRARTAHCPPQSKIIGKDMVFGFVSQTAGTDSASHLTQLSHADCSRHSFISLAYQIIPPFGGVSTDQNRPFACSKVGSLCPSITLSLCPSLLLSVSPPPFLCFLWRDGSTVNHVSSQCV